MLTIGYSTRKHNPEFIEYLKKSSGYKKIEVIEKINNGEKSLSETYNEILSESKTDIVALCHDDIYFDTSSWYSKIINHFEKTDYGILGVAGTTFMPKSGMWWEDRSKMIGIVNHESEGKKWESKYSNSFGNNIRETVVVDGVFIVVNKKNIKKLFDETVPGFHFYDIQFCFRNFLEGVKIGVISNVRITHKSIGMTNQQWEKNRISFVENYNSFLPSYIPFKDSDVLRILIYTSTNSNFDNLVKIINQLNDNKWEVSLISNNSKDIKLKIKKPNIPSYNIDEPPGYKMGDGVWSLKTNEGVKLSQKGVLYKMSETNYNLVIIQESKDLIKILKSFPVIPKIDITNNNNAFSHITIKEKISSENFVDKIEKVILSTLNSEFKKNDLQKIKILSGYSDKGGSTVAHINLTNFFNENGYDCTFYGPHEYHIDKCKSGFSNEIKLESEDTLICHMINLEKRPEVKRVIYSCHEKWWFDFEKVNWYWDTAIFLHNEHKNFHKKYSGRHTIIPNLKESLYQKEKTNLDKIAGIIGTIEDRKQTHVSIKRAIDDGCDTILIFGQVGDQNYFSDFVEPLLVNDKIVLMGYSSNKQEMYDSIGRVYHSSKGEVACLVKDECYSTNTKFFGNEETDNEVSKLSNEEILNLWKTIIE